MRTITLEALQPSEVHVIALPAASAKFYACQSTPPVLLLEAVRLLTARSTVNVDMSRKL